MWMKDEMMGKSSQSLTTSKSDGTFFLSCKSLIPSYWNCTSLSHSVCVSEMFLSIACQIKYNGQDSKLR